MEKVTIIGNGGAGKSTLAIALGKVHQLPVYHLDQIIWRPNWEALTEHEFCLCHRNILSKGKWIIEGLGYDSTIVDRFRSSDTIIYLDYPVLTHMFWAVKRSLKSVVKQPEGWSAGCQLIRKLPYILRIIWHVHQTTRGYIHSLMSEFSSSKTIYHIKNPSSLRKFYDAHVYCS